MWRLNIMTETDVINIHGIGSSLSVNVRLKYLNMKHIHKVCERERECEQKRYGPIGELLKYAHHSIVYVDHTICPYFKARFVVFVVWLYFIYYKWAPTHTNPPHKIGDNGNSNGGNGHRTAAMYVKWCVIHIDREIGVLGFTLSSCPSNRPYLF